MLEQVELEYRIKNNGELMESLGYIEEKINDLIAAKVNWILNTWSFLMEGMSIHVIFRRY